MKKLYLSAVAMTLCAHAIAADLTPFSATYVLNIDGRKGSATRTLSQNGNAFTYQVSARAAGIATANQNAIFSLSGGRVRPSQASLSYRVAGIGRTHTIRFSGASVVSSYKGNAVTLPASSNTYDDLSLEAQIRQELLNNKFSGVYNLVKKDRVERVQFRRAGNFTVSTPAGSYNTVRIDRVHDDNDRVTRFWLAPDLNYLPVQVSQIEDGKSISMTLSAVH